MYCKVAPSLTCSSVTRSFIMRSISIQNKKPNQGWWEILMILLRADVSLLFSNPVKPGGWRRWRHIFHEGRCSRATKTGPGCLLFVQGRERDHGHGADGAQWVPGACRREMGRDAVAARRRGERGALDQVWPHGRAALMAVAMDSVIYGYKGNFVLWYDLLSYVICCSFWLSKTIASPLLRKYSSELKGAKELEAWGEERRVSPQYGNTRAPQFFLVIYRKEKKRSLVTKRTTPQKKYTYDDEDTPVHS